MMALPAFTPHDMTQDAPDPSDRPLLPPTADAGPGLLRWGVAVVALVLLLLGAWQAYDWLAGDVARRRAVAENGAEAPPQPAASADVAAMPDALSGVGTGGGRTVRPPQPGVAGGEPPAPAVAGGGVNKCVTDGQVTYTNAPCPEGSQAAQAADTPGMDANGVTGSTGDGVPAVVARPAPLSGGADPSQQAADCSFLTAEIGRLDYEFQQPLPPAVLDHISTRLSGLRAQAGAARCAPPPKADAASAPTRRRDISR